MGVTILTSIEGCKKLCHKSSIQYIMEQEIVSQIYYSVYYGARNCVTNLLFSILWSKKLCHTSTIQYIMEPCIVLLAFLTYSVGMILISDHKH